MHPNTVRRYEEWGLIPPAERQPNGYRRFTRAHVDCLRLARMVYREVHPGRALRGTAGRVLARAVAGDWRGALDGARAHLELVRAERAQAERAAALLEQWAKESEEEGERRKERGEWREGKGERGKEKKEKRKGETGVRIGEAARLLGVSVDVLRNWERNGFVAVTREVGNRYRAYGPQEIERLRVVRLLSRAGYSQMAILRTLLRLDRGELGGLRGALDTPRPDEEVYSPADRWLSTLAAQEEVARRMVGFVEEVAGRS
jgi:DNA-binding transcriptional MerR regulator